MKLLRTASVYSILMGLIIIATWIMLLSTNQVSEIETNPVSIGFHLFSEAFLAISLIISGIFIFKRSRKIIFYFYFSTGLLISSIIHAGFAYAGYGALGGAAGFLGLLIITLAIFLPTFGKNKHFILFKELEILSGQKISKSLYTMVGMAFYSMINLAGIQLEQSFLSPENRWLGLNHFVPLTIILIIISLIIVSILKAVHRE